MDVSRVLRFLVAALILISGIVHLGAALSLSGADTGVLAVAAAFGVL